MSHFGSISATAPLRHATLPAFVVYMFSSMAAHVDTQFVVAKCDYFTEVQLWPLDQKVSPTRWLGNFDPEDLAYATHLLNAFLYFSEALVDQLFAAAVQKLSTLALPIETSFFRMQSAWKAFLDSALVTFVTGEKPNPTDSGQLFSRKARQVLGFSEDCIIAPDEGAEELLSGPSRPVIFVDDFVGSGSQFLHTWVRQVRTRGGTDISLRSLPG